MKRLFLGLWVVWACACSGRVSEPSGLADPVGPVTMVLRNTTASEVYVRWAHDAPTCDINLNGKHLDIQSWCSTPCEKGCSCLDCAPEPPAVKRIPAGAKLSFTWSGTWYEPQSCGSGCSCDTVQTTLSGKYEITVAGARGYKASGATPTDKDGVLTPAELELAQGACKAQLLASLVAGAQTIELPITCTPSP